MEAQLDGALARRSYHARRSDLLGTWQAFCALTTLFDIFGFVIVVPRGFDLVPQTVLIGSAAFMLFGPVPPRRGAGRGVRGFGAGSRRLSMTAPAATVRLL